MTASRRPRPPTFKVQHRSPRGWKSYEIVLFQDEAEALFDYLRLRRDRDGDRLFRDIRILHGNTVMREERDGAAVALPRSVEDRLDALEARVFGGNE